ncbi:unnamed protein product [Microthlaspi erraticum]|uniref:Uncharacterized protein n=1 Tax=Microthlaspi erraticum TaxID=1685480 RepID=A0A6D2KEY2_9BRAS|nr:unnamed protein product [Microthlaspi erraticum]
MVGLAQPMPKKVKVKLWDLKQAHLGGSPMCQGASSTDSSIELETRATRSSYTTRPGTLVKNSNKMLTVREAASQRKGEKQGRERLQDEGFGDETRRDGRDLMQGICLL